MTIRLDNIQQLLFLQLYAKLDNDGVLDKQRSIMTCLMHLD
jgi:hypothetical protein